MFASTHHTRVFSVACHVSLAGLLYGLDTGSIGPITEMSQFHASIGHLSSTQQGIYVASILLAASASSLASGNVSDRISRKYGILSGGALTTVGALISAVSPNFASLIIARLITGFGAGQAVAVATVYLVEVAPMEIRGVTACLLQFYVTVGITAGYFIAFGSRNLPGSIAWRVPFIVQAGAALVLTTGMTALPFSPRWLVQKGRSDEARVVLRRLRDGEEKVESELVEIQRSRAESQDGASASFREIVSRRYIKRTMLGVLIMALQQMTGIDAVLYFAPILFQQAGLTTTRASFLASGVTGLVLIACTLPAQIWVDNWGRKRPLIIGGSAMAVCLLVIGALYARYGVLTEGAVLMESHKAQWAVVVLIYLFTANFSWSWAVVGKIYACEIIPTKLRAKVCAVEQLANWLVNFTVAITAPVFLRSSPSGPYFLYGFSTLAAVILCLFIPETKGKSLEEVEILFEKKSDEGRGEAFEIADRQA